MNISQTKMDAFQAVVTTIKSANIQERTEPGSWTTRDIIYMTAESLNGFLIIVVNSYILCSLYQHQNLRTLTNYHVGSLAVADMMVGIIVAPIVVLSHAGLPENFYACVFMNSCVLVFLNISILNFTSVVCDRYYAIRHSIRYMVVVTKRRTFCVILSMWILGAVVGLVPMVGLHNDPENFTTCSYSGSIDLAFNVYVHFFGFLTPILILVLVLHIRIYYTFHEMNVRRSNKIAHKESHKEMTRRKEIRLFKSLAFIFSTFALCWVPLQILDCLQVWDPENPVDLDMLLTFVVMTHIHSFFGPLIYIFNQSNFRHRLNKSIPTFMLRLEALHISTTPKPQTDQSTKELSDDTSITSKLYTDDNSRPIKCKEASTEVSDISNQPINSIHFMVPDSARIVETDERRSGDKARQPEIRKYGQRPTGRQSQVGVSPNNSSSAKVWPLDECV